MLGHSTSCLALRPLQGCRLALASHRGLREPTSPEAVLPDHARGRGHGPRGVQTEHITATICEHFSVDTAFCCDGGGQAGSRRVWEESPGWPW